MGLQFEKPIFSIYRQEGGQGGQGGQGEGIGLSRARYVVGINKRGRKRVRAGLFGMYSLPFSVLHEGLYYKENYDCPIFESRLKY